jgi:hypothetical protein
MLSKPQKLTIGLLVIVFLLVGGITAFFRFASGNQSVPEGEALGEEITMPEDSSFDAENESTPKPSATPKLTPKASATKKPLASTTPKPTTKASVNPTPSTTPSPSPSNELTVSCSPDKDVTTIGQPITWTATPSGGVGNYAYLWSGTENLSSTAHSFSKTYEAAGEKEATVTVTSGDKSTTKTCDKKVRIDPAPSPTT